MALHIRTPPKGAATLLSKALEKFPDIFDAPGDSDGRRRVRVRRRRSRPIPLYNLVPAQLLGPYRRLAEVAGKASGWRYLLTRKEQLWYADLRCGEKGLTLNQVVGGAQADRFAIACRRASEEAPAGSDLRVVRMPSTRFQALWLAGKSDLFIDLDFAEDPVLSGPELLQTAFR